jgi:co-chaperonin GroES (HSP10)
MRTTEGNLLVEIDTSDGLIRENLFTATVIADTSEEDISKGDQVIVERDYVQFIDKKIGYAPIHSRYAIISEGKIKPLKDRVYILADRDKRNKITKGSISLDFPTNFKQFQTEITTHDGIVAASPVDHISPGDKVYCHHHLTHPSNERYVNGIMYYEMQVNQIYCTIKENDIQMHNGWNLITPILSERNKSLKFHKFDSDKSDKYGVIAHHDPNAYHLQKGQQIVFLPDRDYEMIIEGERYYRIRTQDIVARCQETT